MRSLTIAAITILLSGVSQQVLSQPANVTLSPQFSPNPMTLRGTAGGAISVAESVGSSDSQTGPCTGYANRTPDHTLTLKAFFKSLNVDVESSQDTALVIRGPGGLWCNDDNRGKNPGISGQWLPGEYDIWVSTYSKNQSAPYSLKVTRK